MRNGKLNRRVLLNPLNINTKKARSKPSKPRCATQKENGRWLTGIVRIGRLYDSRLRIGPKTQTGRAWIVVVAEGFNGAGIIQENVIDASGRDTLQDTRPVAHSRYIQADRSLAKRCQLKQTKCLRCSNTENLKYAYPLVEEDGSVKDNRVGGMLCPDCHEENDRRAKAAGILIDETREK
jgi:hypothetical protein